MAQTIISPQKGSWTIGYEYGPDYNASIYGNATGSGDSLLSGEVIRFSNVEYSDLTENGASGKKHWTVSNAGSQYYLPYVTADNPGRVTVSIELKSGIFWSDDAQVIGINVGFSSNVAQNSSEFIFFPGQSDGKTYIPDNGVAISFVGTYAGGGKKDGFHPLPDVRVYHSNNLQSARIYYTGLKWHVYSKFEFLQ